MDENRGFEQNLGSVIWDLNVKQYLLFGEIMDLALLGKRCKLCYLQI